ncbi:MAG: hypothetical protein C0501_01005 [Isosphaera sp.]|nr:hypothetical protein [Isosphaera sp.]
MSAAPPPAGRRPPWRSAAVGWAAAALALFAGAPLFLCMPPWNDVTLHDAAVRAILRGGVHYRDVFDTNPPGVDWAMAAVRAAFGWRYEVLRAVDLVVVAAAAGLLAGWVRRAGGTAAAAAWLAAAVALWYPFASEFCHVQRDGWMLLPALAAARLRLARVGGADDPGFGRSVGEGLLWGAAVWVKPHVVVPAFAVWAVSAAVLARRVPGRRVRADLAGLLLGGLLAGAAGVGWLVGTGAWPYFLDVFLRWNPEYAAGIVWGAGGRFEWLFVAFRPWGLVHAAALPLAVLGLWEGRAWSRRPGEPRRVWGAPWAYAPAGTEAAANARALLAALYLGWLGQAVVLQKGFDYVQVPVLLLGMAVVATHRWAVGFGYLVWFAVLGVMLNVTDWVPDREPAPGVPVVRLEPHPLTDPKVMALWPRCWREGGSPELRTRLGHYTDIHCGTNWEQLDDVARFLRGLDPPLGPGELNCWHDSTHPLYLILDLDPATRFLHYGTVLGIASDGDWVKRQVAAEVAASRQRYVVADLARMTWDRKRPHDPGAGGDPRRLPAWFPVSQRGKFPWNQDVVYRSGRYVVYRVARPLGEVDIPDWLKLDELGPGEAGGP